jgi:drug/metabolite transporter (DMT)-like permease
VVEDPTDQATFPGGERTLGVKRSSVMTRRSWALFAAVAILWGVPYLLIKIVVADLPPVWLAFSRLLLSAAVLVPLALQRGAFRALRGRAGSLVALGLTMAALPFWLIAYGEQHIASGLAGLLVATQPTVIVLLSWALGRGKVPDERLTGKRIAGIAVGLAGVAVLSAPTLRGHDGKVVLGAGAVLLGTISYAVGALIVRRRFAGVPPLSTTAGGHAVALCFLAPFALTDLPASVPPAGALIALTVLGLGCTASAFLCFNTLIGTVGPAQASLALYIAPVVAVALGSLFLAEPLTVWLCGGTLLVLAGSWLATRAAPGPSHKSGRREVAPAESCTQNPLADRWTT